MTDDADGQAAGQRIVRVPGSRRARLTPVPGTDTAPDIPHRSQEPASASPGAKRPGATGAGAKGPNDDRLRQDVPPHY